MDLSCFLNKDALTQEEVKFVASKRYKDKQGNPVEWILKCISADEDSEIRKSCQKRVSTGKRGQFSMEFDSEGYMAKLAASCVVYPNLLSAELQDFYKVKGEEALIKKMLNSGEYVKLLEKVQEINGFDESFEDKVEIAKN